MKVRSLVVFLIYSINLSFAVIPLPSSPSWSSNDTDYSTGGALFDVTMDTWIDYCTGNGNDMASNQNGIYLNQNGTLETTASWRSTESGYFSHIYIGDVNNDGFPEMAVSYLGFGSANQGPTSIYINTGTGLNSTAWWTSADQYNSFDCAFGDVDLDADLDLAVAAGDAYTALESPTRVYRNNSGTIETTPYWTSTDSTPGDACRWADLDNDGYLDLIVGYLRKLAVFSNINGTLEQVASWSTIEPGWILRVAVGDYNNDGYKDVAVACNGQLSGDISRIEVYRNEDGVLQTPPEYVMLANRSYCSCVEWGDVNNDGWIDLAAGGWWEPVVVFENNAGVIDTIPTWSWNGGSGLVCETVMWGDVRNNALLSISENKSGDGTRKLFYFDHHPIQSFEEIRVEGTPVPLSDFCYDPLTGWVSLMNAPPSGTDNVEIRYTYSRYPDLGVTNWNRSNGNYLFSNTTGIHEFALSNPAFSDLQLKVYPNPFRKEIKIRCIMQETRYETQDYTLKIYDVSGRLVRQWDNKAIGLSDQIAWHGVDNLGQSVPAGIYLVEFKVADKITREKIVLVR